MPSKELTVVCGKSTLCPILAKRLGAKAYSTPPKKYLRTRTSVDKDAPANEHYRFYRDGIYDASEEIAAMLRNGDSVVSDRYWLTTYTYHEVMGVLMPKDDFCSIVIPTLTVILSLNHGVQANRMLHRGLSMGDRRMLDAQRELTALFYKNVLEFNLPFLVLDTQRFLPEACAEIVTNALGTSPIK